MQATKSRPVALGPGSLSIGILIGIALTLGGVAVGSAAGISIPSQHAVVSAVPPATLSTTDANVDNRTEYDAQRAAVERLRTQIESVKISAANGTVGAGRGAGGVLKVRDPLESRHAVGGP
jgi:hypothetical protein